MSRATLPIIFIFCFLLSVRVSGFTNLFIGDTQEHQLDIYPEKELLWFNILNYKAKLYHLRPKILATKWRMDIGRDGYWKPHVSNSSALSVPKISKAVAARKK